MPKIRKNRLHANHDLIAARRLGAVGTQYSRYALRNPYIRSRTFGRKPLKMPQTCRKPYNGAGKCTDLAGIGLSDGTLPTIMSCRVPQRKQKQSSWHGDLANHHRLRTGSQPADGWRLPVPCASSVECGPVEGERQRYHHPLASSAALPARCCCAGVGEGNACGMPCCRRSNDPQTVPPAIPGHRGKLKPATVGRDLLRRVRTVRPERRDGFAAGIPSRWQRKSARLDSANAKRAHSNLTRILAALWL